MNLEITDKKENPLLSRTEVKGTIGFDKATPSNAEVKKAIAEKAKADESLIVVKNIYTDFGSTNANFNAYIYTNKDEMAKIEPKKKEKKAKPGEKKEEAPAAKPKEEKKEEPKEEKKEEKAE